MFNVFSCCVFIALEFYVLYARNNSASNWLKYADLTRVNWFFFILLLLLRPSYISASIYWRLRAGTRVKHRFMILSTVDWLQCTFELELNRLWDCIASSYRLLAGIPVLWTDWLGAYSTSILRLRHSSLDLDLDLSKTLPRSRWVRVPDCLSRLTDCCSFSFLRFYRLPFPLFYPFTLFNFS